MNQHDDEFPDLRRQTADLPREIPPARNLWPGIKAGMERLDARAAVSRSPFRRFRMPLAVAAAFALAAGLYWFRPSSFGPSWVVDSLAGTPQIDRTPVTGTARLAVDQWLETNDRSRAKVTVGTIGEVSLEPNSRVRLVSTAANNHRLELARGTMSAFIWAPPRLFFVDTPSATAIDLGCAYTLTVDDQGAGTLEVTSGYVALEHGGLESIIPAGLMCLTRPGFGPGIPFTTDASPELREALARFDAGDETLVPRILGVAAAGDGVTLWHVLERAPEAMRGRVFDKLALLHPPPAGVTRGGILARDRAMRDRWAEELGLFAGFNPQP